MKTAAAIPMVLSKLENFWKSRPVYNCDHKNFRMKYIYDEFQNLVKNTSQY